MGKNRKMGDEQENEEEKMMRFLRKWRGWRQKINAKDLTRSHRRPWVGARTLDYENV